MPSAVSILKNAVLEALRTGRKSFAFPDTAVNGETFDALFAGERAARRTVRITHTYTGKDTGKAYFKGGHTLKVFRAEIAQHSAQSPNHNNSRRIHNGAALP
jgi:hypothetical protein